jgi:hypothetical protein
VRHQPKKLALLISLIGAGVSPLASARTDERIVGVGLTRSAIDQVLEASATADLDRTRWSLNPILRIDESEFDLARPLEALSTADSSNESSESNEISEVSEVSEVSEAPGTQDGEYSEICEYCEEAKAAPGYGEPADVAVQRVAVQSAKPELAEAASIDPRLNANARLQRARAFIQGFIAKSQTVEAVDEDGGPGDASQKHVATLRFNAGPLVQPDAQPSSAYADRLMERLAAVKLKSLDPWGGEFEAFGDLRGVSSKPQASRGEPSAMSAGRSEILPATHADKVLATLFEVRSAREAKGIDIDLTLPFEAAAAASTSISKSNQVQSVMGPTPLPVAEAAERKVRPNPFGGEQVALSEESLNGVRGGFITEGLNISFGIERAIYVNGTLVTTTSLNVSDLGRISAGRGTTALDTGALALVQTGAGNTVSSGAFSAGSIGAVVQNSLDGQKIQNVTLINATVNSLSVLRSFNLQSSLRGAVIDSLRR